VTGSNLENEDVEAEVGVEELDEDKVSLPLTTNANGENNERVDGSLISRPNIVRRR
jgi:hypothetical protein